MEKGRNTRAFWNGKDYGAWGDSTEFGAAETHNPTRYFLDKLLPALSGKRVLELGCGPGALTPSLAASASSVVGVDFSRSCIDAARPRCARLRNMSFEVADALEYRSDHRFDALLGRGGFIYFHENSFYNPLARFVRNRLVGHYGIPKHGSPDELPFDRERFEMYRRRFRYAERRALWVEAGTKVFEYLVRWKFILFERGLQTVDRCLTRLQKGTGWLDDLSYSQAIYASHDPSPRTSLGPHRPS